MFFHKKSIFSDLYVKRFLTYKNNFRTYPKSKVYHKYSSNKLAVLYNVKNTYHKNEHCTIIVRTFTYKLMLQLLSPKMAYCFDF